ncbi:ATP-binding protein [Curvivirga aplysinae]|uniref:ATP-binding protein n=1 Tax=Curvivirga aplysinae TaxID=2529852 RepID=UPI0012BCC32D|nr:ATP-binding protein [Curvivirga aplysinae]MTI10709.1 ATP-binding protein [Curvivirga aplysinae]
MGASKLLPTLTRIAEALDRLAPAAIKVSDLSDADAYVWHTDPMGLEPVERVNRVDFDLLRGIPSQKEQLLENTKRFANGLPANNALLWGAKGTGKSSIVKAVHGRINADAPGSLKLVEIHREDIPTLPNLLSILKKSNKQCVLFCDDLSFDTQDDAYKSLKAVLEGGIEGRPDNVIFYATSNRRHLMARDMIENERSTAINPSEAIEENVSLSDRFGLWLGFHNCNQETYFDMIRGYVEAYNLGVNEAEWKPKAVEWTVTRGARSGRVAWQFVQDLAGSLGKHLK